MYAFFGQGYDQMLASIRIKIFKKEKWIFQPYPGNFQKSRYAEHKQTFAVYMRWVQIVLTAGKRGSPEI